MITWVVFGAFIMEVIDSSMGMLYGTILSPVLILAGYNPKEAIPALLLSQAIGGFIASLLHHKKGNVNLMKGNDLKAGLLISGLGILATVAAALIAVKVSKSFLETYIGTIVVIMGTILLFGRKFDFSWLKMAGLALLSAFNKSLSGGGYGPIVTSGQTIIGRKGKNSIGVTTFAEAPICVAGFMTYLFANGITNWNLVLSLCVGSGIGGIIGPFITARFKGDEKLKFILGIMTLALGVLVLFLKIKT